MVQKAGAADERLEVHMRPSRLVIVAVLLVLGLLWIGQGLGYIGGSAMSGASIWAVIGAILVIAALAIAWSERRTAARSH